MTAEGWDGGEQARGGGQGNRVTGCPSHCREKHPLRAYPEKDLFEKIAKAEEELQQHEHSRPLLVKFRPVAPLFHNPGIKPENQRNRNRSQQQLEPKHGGKDLRVDNGLII
jgi:hypothetical protein